MLAAWLADAIDPLFDLFNNLGQSELGRQDPVYDELVKFPGMDVWEGFYRNPAEMFREFVRATLAGLGLSREACESLLEILPGRLSSEEFNRECRRNLASVPKRMRSGLCRRISGKMLPWLAKARENPFWPGEGHDNPEGGLSAYLSRPAVKFMLRVFLPCLIIHHDAPSRLLKRAAEGHYASLGKLLSVDKRSLYLREAADVHHYLFSRDPRRWRATIPAYLRQPFPVISKARLKQTATAVLYDLFRHIGYALCGIGKSKEANLAKSPSLEKLRELFTAYAGDFGQIAPPQADPDVPPEGFRKGVSRIRKDAKELWSLVNVSVGTNK